MNYTWHCSILAIIFITITGAPKIGLSSSQYHSSERQVLRQTKTETDSHNEGKLKEHGNSCEECVGSGKCHYCKGVGTTTSPPFYKLAETADCSPCNGTGNCTDCNGTGKQR